MIAELNPPSYRSFLNSALEDFPEEKKSQSSPNNDNLRTT